MRCRLSSFLLAIAVAAVPALAQDRDGGQAAPTPGSRPECQNQAALYGAGAVRVWVTRRGSMREENPLRPLSRDTLVVLEVRVNGRIATAFGPDIDNLRQGGSPARLQEAGGAPITWDRSPPDLPEAFRIVAEDGTRLIGPLTFMSCGEAPAAAPERPAATKTAPRPVRRDPNADAERPGLPRGAIPSRGGGGGLSLPQP